MSNGAEQPGVGRDLLAGLNEGQREAVVHEGGPLVVLAGPGTGKTRVIIHRVAWAIDTRGVAPDRVLAVTFTVKAAEELRTRLEGLLGPEQAAPIRTHTFNGFGWRLVQRFADCLGLPASTTMIDAVQTHRLLRDIVVRDRLFPHARAEGVEVLCGRLAGAFKTLAMLGKLPEECLAHAKAWRERFDAGERGEDAVAEEFRLRTWEDEARAYAAYSALRWRRGWLTFDDQLLLPIRLLREHPGPASIVRSELATVVVDEFQDCNPAQIELLRLLIGPGTRGAPPDVAVVGDDDQAIYAFRGADERSFERFRRAWPGAREVELTDNYRSGARIVSVSNAIIARANRRFHADKMLRPAAGTKAVTQDVEVVGLVKESDDAVAIATLLRLDGAGRADMPWGRYAVIARSNGDLARIAEVLRLEGIPFDLSTDKTVLDDDVVDDALAWARWVIDADDVTAITRALTRPPVGLPGDEAVALRLAWRAASGRAREGVPGATDPGTMTAWLERSHAANPSVTSACARRAALARDLAGMRGDQALTALLTTLDLVHADLGTARQRARRVSAVVALLSLVRDAQPRLEPPGDLAALLRHLDQLRDLKAFKPPASLNDDELDEPAQAEGDGAYGRVQVITAHKAKGLEFDTVFVPRIGGQHGYGSIKSRDAWEPPAGLFDALDDRDESARARDESRRLFYVACTRAERRLILMGYWKEKVGKSANLLDEVARPALPGVQVHLQSDLAAQAARAGITISAGDGGTMREPAAAFAERARTAARVELAAALEAVEASDTDESARLAARRVVVEATDRLAALAESFRAGRVPDWHTPAHPDVVTLAARVAGEAARPVSIIRPMPAPLRLSYSMLKAYQDCPRCFYLRYVMNLGEAESDEANLGSVIHVILHRYFDRVRLAAAEGTPPPGADALFRLAREVYHAHLGEAEAPDRGVLEQIEAQLNLCLTRLHDPAANILELEHSIRFPYTVDGVAHEFTAKIDRIEQIPDGSYRVVDYKSGKAAKYLTEPKGEDLQFGVYALALRHLFGEGIDAAFEYWVLSTGQRGRLALADMKHDKVARTIDDAVRGMLSGEFPRKDSCQGDCRLVPE
ncbi:MAG: hypothetical protein HBSAPP03_10150 [Phycisphaerae bacterium]|nr:MAG: hypothetical protein HBSAPP03_10150 [Phycisphaerae bacterium]